MTPPMLLTLALLLPAVVAASAIRGTSSTLRRGPGSYYDGINPNASSSELKKELHNLISSDTHHLSYNDIWYAFNRSDNDVIEGCHHLADIYSSYCWEFPDQKCGEYRKEGDCFNREHLWPKSWWGDSESYPSYTDIGHLFPTDGYVNQQRESLPPCIVSKAKYTSTDGTKIGSGSSDDNYGFSGDCYELPDEYKGDQARVYFYMSDVWDCCKSDWNNKADLAPWLEKLLRDWHEKDPVSYKETHRVDAQYYLQHNRNPFIDHPEWVAKIEDF